MLFAVLNEVLKVVCPLTPIFMPLTEHSERRALQRKLFCEKMRNFSEQKLFFPLFENSDEFFPSRQSLNENFHQLQLGRRAVQIV